MDASSKSPMTVPGALVPAGGDDARSAVVRAVDVAVATAAVTAGAAWQMGRATADVVLPLARPFAGLVLRPPLLHPRLHPATWLAEAERAGAAYRREAARRLGAVLDALVPLVLAEVLDRLDLTAIVLQRVDLDAAAAHVSIDPILDRVDLTGVVQERVNLDAIVAGVDLDAAAARIDIQAVLDRLDLTVVVQQRVDLEAIVNGLDLDAIVAKVDIDKIIDRIDLIALADEVIDGVDLPEIIRESTGSMASETVRGVRMRSIAGDEAIGRAVDRMLLRRRQRQTLSRGRRPPQLPGDGPEGSGPEGSGPGEGSRSAEAQTEAGAVNAER